MRTFKFYVFLWFINISALLPHGMRGLRLGACVALLVLLPGVASLLCACVCRVGGGVGIFSPFSMGRRVVALLPGETLSGARSCIASVCILVPLTLLIAASHWHAWHSMLPALHCNTSACHTTACHAHGCFLLRVALFSPARCASGIFPSFSLFPTFASYLLPAPPPVPATTHFTPTPHCSGTASSITAWAWRDGMDRKVWLTWDRHGSWQTSPHFMSYYPISLILLPSLMSSTFPYFALPLPASPSTYLSCPIPASPSRCQLFMPPPWPFFDLFLPFTTMCDMAWTGTTGRRRERRHLLYLFYTFLLWAPSLTLFSV